MGLSFTIAAGPRQRSHSQIRFSRGTQELNLLSQIQDSLNLEDQVPVVGGGGTHKHSKVVS
jgi:hypothetical protein